MPTDHPCNLTGAESSNIARADVLLFLGVDDVWGTINRVPDTVSRAARLVAKPDVKTISIAIDDYSARGNIQDQQHATDMDLPIIADPEATLPYLIDAVRTALGGSANDRIAQRMAAVKADHVKLRRQALEDAAIGWDASPVNLARLTAELGSVVGHDNSTVVTNSSNFFSAWPQRLWNLTKWNQFQMNSGAGGLGFTTPSAIGAALANRKTGSTTVAFQTDGDFMYVNSSLWTMAHHKIPVMVVMHNNRAYHAEHMNIQTMANRRQRKVDDTGLGTTIVNPPINYAMMARSMGVEGIGPITDASALRSALERGRHRQTRRTGTDRRGDAAAMMKALTVLFVACCAVLLPSIVRADPAADHGKQLFLANNCYLCHGTVGQGGAAGPTIAPPKLLPTYEAFAAWVRKTGPGVMPVYTAKVLSDADLAAIYRRSEKPSPPASIPAVLTHP